MALPGSEGFQEQQASQQHATANNQNQGAAAPATPQQQPQQQPQQGQGPIQEDPGFRSLPRHLQVQVEQGGMTLEQAMGANQGQGGQAGTSPTTPGPTPNAENAPPIPQGGGPAPNANAQANVPAATPEAGASRLSLGQALEGGKTGQDTFRRAGTSGFRSFAGQEFSPFALRPEAQKLSGGAGAALSARQALEQGNVGRQLVGGVGGGVGAQGFGQSGRDDDFVNDLLRQ